MESGCVYSPQLQHIGLEPQSEVRNFILRFFVL